MNRPLLASLAVGMGVACGCYNLAPAWAQARGSQDRGQSGPSRSNDSDRDTERRSDGASQKIEQALQSYESYRDKMGPNVDQTRKEVDRLRDELAELIKLRCDMAISLAEARAESTAPGMMTGSYRGQQSAAMQGYPGATQSYDAMMAAAKRGTAAANTQGSGDTDQSSRQERQRARREALNRELRQLQEQLRAEVEQNQGQTDQLVAQLRELRTQQRQLQEQMKGERERQQPVDQRGGEAADNANDPSRKEGGRDQKQPNSRDRE
jgi:chromosome segregation ATPase